MTCVPFIQVVVRQQEDLLKEEEKYWLQLDINKGNVQVPALLCYAMLEPIYTT